MPIDIPTASVPREKYVHYWRNAQECFAGMQDAALAGRWRLTALNGIHCVIASADALLVYTAGVRSRSKQHNDVSGCRIARETISEREKGYVYYSSYNGVTS